MNSGTSAPLVSGVSASSKIYREEWPSQDGFPGGEWRFVPVAAQLALYDAKPRFNHYAIQLPVWGTSRQLDEKQVSALHVARKLLQRGEAPPVPRYLAKTAPAAEKPGFKWVSPAWSSPDRSDEEERFLTVIAPQVLSPASQQCLHTQVPFTAFTGDTIGQAGRIDFALLHPELEGQILIEIDGAQHQSAQGRAADAQRDQALQAAGHQIVRIPVDEIRRGNGPQLDRLKALQTQIPVDSGRDLGQLAAVQVMSVFVDLLEFGRLDPRADAWGIEIIGPYRHAVAAGIQAARKLLAACADLYGCSLLPADVDLFVDVQAPHADVVLEWRDDLPWWAKSSATRDPESIVCVRPTWLPARPGLPIPPADWVQPNVDAPDASFRTLLQTLYPQMEDFRDGQLFGIKRCLEGKDSVVLLPTGAGKSLIYQMSAFLMPGLVVVVAPIVALMVDQVQNLNRSGIDRAEALSGDMSRGQKAELLERLKGRSHALVYVSPERFQIQEFRETLVAVRTQMPIPLFVIDEAHCLSEWGHDFRPAYLNIARTARRYGRRSANIKPAVVGLTGTASRAVLRDLMAELGIEELEAVIMPKSFNRPELHFRVEMCDSDEKEATLEGVLRGLPAKFGVPSGQLFQSAGERTTCGIVFCPHVKGDYGVVRVAQSLGRVTGHDVPYFAGGDQAQTSAVSALAFKNNERPLLVATKAFGMGIDKPNVRYTVHYGMPMSLEAFYQEAGRAGRNRQDAQSVVLLSVRDKPRAEDVLSPARPVEDLHRFADDRPGDDITRALYFHASSYRGVESDLREVESCLSDLWKSSGQAVHVFRYSQDKDADRVLERALHRLILLGIVRDYTKDYSHRTIEAVLHWPQAGEVWGAAYDHVCSYSQKRAEALFDARRPPEGLTLEKEALLATRRLLEFTYETIERARRAAILSVWHWAKGANGDRDLRERLLLYLQETEFSKEVDRILRESEFDLVQWRALLENVLSPRDLAELDAGLERALSDFPDHPAVTAMKSVVAARRRDHETAMLYAVACFDALGTRFAASQKERWEFAHFVITSSHEQRVADVPGLVRYVTKSASLEECRIIERWGLPEHAIRGMIPRLAELARNAVKSITTSS